MLQCLNDRDHCYLEIMFLDGPLGSVLHSSLEISGQRSPIFSCDKAHCDVTFVGFGSTVAHRMQIRTGKRIRPTTNRGKLSGWGKGAYPGNLQALDFWRGID